MLEVSHEDIRTDYIVDFPVEDRFLKLPIDKYLDELNIDPIGPQIALINAVNDPRFRFITACLSRRTGKTTIANIVLQVTALMPGTEVLIIAPNFQLASISWDLQVQYLERFGIERSRQNQKDKVIVLNNGSVIRIASVSQVDSAVGRSYDLIIFDEAALEDKGGEAFNVALRPTLDKDWAKCIFISTPRGDNYFKKFYDRGFDPEFPEWASIRSTWHENPRVSEKDIRQAQKAISKAEFAQEYMADFTTFEGQIFLEFDDDNVEDLSELDTSQMEIIGGLDLGYNDPTAFVVIAIDYDTGIHYVLDGFEIDEKTTPVIAGMLNEYITEYDIDYVYIDSAAAQTKADFAMHYGITCINANKEQKEGLGYVAGVIEKKRLIVDSRLIGLQKSIVNLRWNPKSVRPQQQHNEWTHYCDALRYALYTHSPNIVHALPDLDHEELSDELIELEDEFYYDDL